MKSHIAHIFLVVLIAALFGCGRPGAPAAPTPTLPAVASPTAEPPSPSLTAEPASPSPGPEVTPPANGGGAPPAGGTEAPVELQTEVESIDVLILESFPVQVNAVIRGTLPDACAYVEDAIQEREGNTFRLTLQLAWHPDRRCMPAATPFEHTVALAVAGLPAGTYTVESHGATATFELSVDNELPEGS